MCDVSPVGQGGHTLAEGRGVKRRQGLAQLRRVHDLALPAAAAAAAAVGLLLRKRVEQREQARGHRVALCAGRARTAVSDYQAPPGSEACCYKRGKLFIRPDAASVAAAESESMQVQLWWHGISVSVHRQDADVTPRCTGSQEQHAGKAGAGTLRGGSGLGRSGPGGPAAHRKRVARQAQQALPERGAVPQALHDHVEEAVVLARLVLQARLGRRRGAGLQRPRRRARRAQRVALGRKRLQFVQARLRGRATVPC